MITLYFLGCSNNLQVCVVDDWISYTICRISRQLTSKYTEETEHWRSDTSAHDLKNILSSLFFGTHLRSDIIQTLYFSVHSKRNKKLCTVLYPINKANLNTYKYCRKFNLGATLTITARKWVEFRCGPITAPKNW